jgi:hypothetical protein
VRVCDVSSDDVLILVAGMSLFELILFACCVFWVKIC